MYAFTNAFGGLLCNTSPPLKVNKQQTCNREKWHNQELFFFPPYHYHPPILVTGSLSLTQRAECSYSIRAVWLYGILHSHPHSKQQWKQEYRPHCKNYFFLKVVGVLLLQGSKVPAIAKAKKKKKIFAIGIDVHDATLEHNWGWRKEWRHPRCKKKEGREWT